MLFLYILAIVYWLAINFYTFLLIKKQKKEATERNAIPPNRNAKIILAGILGGAATAYITLLFLRYKTDNLLLMILLPLLTALNIFIVILTIRGSIYLFS